MVRAAGCWAIDARRLYGDMPSGRRNDVGELAAAYSKLERIAADNPRRGSNNILIAAADLPVRASKHAAFKFIGAAS